MKHRMKKLLVPVMGLALLAPSVMPGTAAAADNVTVRSVEFIGMPAPATPDEMARLYTTASLQVAYSDGSVRSFPLTYKTLFKSTDSINGTVAGVAVDVNGKPIMDTSVPGNPVPFVSDDPDSNSLMAIPGQKPTSLGGNPLSLVTHFEYVTNNNAGKSAYGVVPASMSLTTIDQNKKTGELKAADLKKIDFSAVDGLWIPCNGSLTPWNTHLGSEEYEADARAYEADPTQTYVGPFAKAYYQDDNAVGNPYAYGYLPEVTVNADGTTTVAKHYSMGRFSHELGKVAPDQKTVFFGDDGGYTMLFMYVADKAQDLSAGTLYAAKFTQTADDANGGAGSLQWINLGHATDAEIADYVKQGLKFSDMFETADKDTDGFTKIKTYPSGKMEWLKVKPGMEKAAAFLESRRYAAIQGATSEFNKMEGVAANAKDKKIYVAMSYLEKSTEADAKGADPVDDIHLKKIRAGVVYELALQGGQKDAEGNTINSEYAATAMTGLVAGKDLAQPDWKGNTADDNLIGNPDNLSYSEDLRTLFIGEDSGMHANNYVWAYQIDTKKLSRILTTPAGAEATGLQDVDNLNGFRYIMSNIQHPGDEMILPDALKAQVEPLINKYWDNKRSGSVGYISGVPTMEQMVALKDTDNTLSQLRDEAEKKGAKVTWNEADRSVTITKGTNTMTVKIGEAIAKVNGQDVKLANAVKIENEKAVFPTETLMNFLNK
ncbi:alkaline phosphatase PhoX [Paenibacillus hamazuiensis]|uniref:alkaline phosphatase PhoX n=1 Tax=Paenibacillus hamazuiensis TaxID=2936508 RepID=UPI00200F9801|nr:alkaline phosphatase PhoX [Paenibacillus hamazuiensis]